MPTGEQVHSLVSVEYHHSAVGVPRPSLAKELSHMPIPSSNEPNASRTHGL